jgi:hypothetical protein
MPRARPSSKADIAARKRASRLFSAETVAVPIEAGAADVKARLDRIAEIVSAETVVVPIGGSLPGIADVPGASEAEAAEVKARLDRITKIAHVSREQRLRFREEVRVLLCRYVAETLANQQEHPKREIAAFEPIEADARRLLKRLRSLPEGLRLRLKAGNAETQVEEVAGNAERELAALKRRPAPNRLANPAAVVLRTELMRLIGAHAPDARERDRRVAQVLRLLRIRSPDAKKDRVRFRKRQT